MDGINPWRGVQPYAAFPGVNTCETTPTQRKDRSMLRLVILAALYGLWGASVLGMDALTGADLTSNARVQIALKDPTVVATVVVFLSSKCPCSKSHEPAL